MRTAAPTVAPSASVGQVAGSIYSKTLTGNTLTDEGTFSVPNTAPSVLTIGGVNKFGWILRGAVGAVVDQAYYIIGEECPTVNYNYALSGVHPTGTEYIVTAMSDGAPVGNVLYNGTVPYRSTIYVTGTLLSFCGNIEVERRASNSFPDGVGWQPFTPPSTPPPPAPQPPPPPAPQPPPPDVPSPPVSPNPPAPPAPPTDPTAPPAGGTGGDGEIIEWLKDSNKVQRGISSRQDAQIQRQDIGNEYLKLIKNNGDYANERLQKIDESTQIIAEDVTRKAEAEAAYDAEMPTTQQMAEQGGVAASDVVGAMGALNYTVPTVPTSAPSFNMAFSAGGRSISMNYDPFDMPWLNTACNWLRTVLAWLLAYYFLRWCLDQLVEARRHVELVPQTRGNTLPGGFGGQVTATIAAGIITATMLSMTIVLYGMWRDGAIFTFNVTNLFASNPFSSAPSIIQPGLYVLERIFPVSTALACMGNYMTFKFQVEASVAATAAIKRYINP